MTVGTVNNWPNLGVTGNVSLDGLAVSGTSALAAVTATTLSATAVTATSLTVSGLIGAKSYTLVTLPTATAVGQVIYVSNATGAHVTGSLCFSNAVGAANWIDVTTGVAVV